MHTPVGIKCRGCTNARRKRGPRNGSGRAGRRRPARRSWLGVAAVVAGLVVVAGVAMALMGGGEEGEAPPVALDAAAEGPRDSIVSFFGGDGLRLRGTLRVPDDASGPVPGVVIIPGFGPTDRNGTAPPTGIPDMLYRDLSRVLAEAGVASLRYDKRGTGESPLEADQVLDFDDLADDAGAALTFLGERSEVDPDALALVGHDEGGLAALRVAGTAREAGAVVLISTPGRPLVDVLSDDLMATSPEPGEGEAHVEQLRTAVEELLATGQLPEPGDLRTALRPVFPPGEEAYVRSIFELDPVEEAARVEVPVLIVRGDRDPGVSAADADQLAAALAGDSDVLVGAGSGHTLALEVGDDEASGAVDATGDRGHDRSLHTGTASGIERDDDLLDEIGTWVARVLGVGGAAP